LDKLRINGNWRSVKGRLKKIYRSLTDDDLSYEKGRERELIIQLQRALRRKRADIVSIINYLADTCERGSDVMDSMSEFDMTASNQFREDH
jgi:uncharacterized protein YjbJ (UPF0337 family)